MEKERAMLPALETFIADFRKLYKKDIDDVDRLKEVAQPLEALLADTDLKERAENWPARNDPARGYLKTSCFMKIRITASFLTR